MKTNTDNNYDTDPSGLKILREAMSPRVDPAPAKSDTNKHPRLNSCMKIHVKDNLRIFVCEMYISMGK